MLVFSFHLFTDIYQYLPIRTNRQLPNDNSWWIKWTPTLLMSAVCLSEDEVKRCRCYHLITQYMYQMSKHLSARILKKKSYFWFMENTIKKLTLFGHVLLGWRENHPYIQHLWTFLHDMFFPFWASSKIWNLHLR